MITARIFTDGSCWPNPGANGGWSSVILLPNNAVLMYGRAEPGFGSVLADGVPRTTNNRMELFGILMGLRVIPKHVLVVVRSDSLYAINAVDGSANVSANRDLVDLCHAELRRLSAVTFLHVKGHRGNVYNEMADRLAGEGSAALPDLPLWDGRRVIVISYDGTPMWPGQSYQFSYEQDVTLRLT